MHDATDDAGSDQPVTGLGFRDPYETLGVRRGAGDRAIASAYRHLARQFHPDIAGDAATDRMTRINAAFEAIKDARRRADYDDLAASTSFTRTPAAGTGDDRAARDPRPWTDERDGTGGAGPPPGRPSGSVLGFGRHIGWSLGEIARWDPGYLVWLRDRREGRPYLEEIDATLRAAGVPVPGRHESDAGRATYGAFDRFRRS